MPPDTPPSSAPEGAETMQRMVALTQRALAASAQVQSRTVAQATGSEYSLMDAATLSRAFTNVWAEMLSNPQKLMETQIKAPASMAEAIQSFFTPPEDSDVKQSRDRRFSDKSWDDDPAARLYRDTYLAFEAAITGLLDGMSKDDKDHLRVNFYTRQMLSSLSPSNYLATNAAARNAMLETNGNSFLNGLENMLNDLDRGEGRLDIATNDQQACEVGKDLATTEGEVVFQNELMQLIQYHPRTEKQHAIPLLFVPAWINKFYILDMQPKNSLIRYMLDRGHSVFVISWVNPDKQHADKDFADYMTLGPLAALDAIRALTKQDRAN